MTPTSPTDHALRTMCDEGNFRIVIASTRQTVAEILDAQSPAPSSRGLMADLISASILLRLTMSPDNRLQAILQNQSLGSLVADSHADGTTRGLIRRHGEGRFETRSSTLLSVHRTMFGGDIHQGVVETSEDQSLADAVTGYLHRSEQVTSVVGLGHHFQDDDLVFSGGYIVQLMPEGEEADQATLALMTARLQGLASVPQLFEECEFDTEAVAAELFGPLPYRSLGTNDFHPGCICSVERVRTALDTLSDEEIAELTSDEEVLEVDCDYCGAVHQIEPETLRC